MTDKERVLLGTVLATGRPPQMKPEHFSDADGRKVWLAIEACIERGLTINIVNAQTVSDVKPALLAELTSESLPHSDLEYYISAVIRDYRSREYSRIGRLLAGMASDPEEASQWLEEQLANLSGQSDDIRMLHLNKAVKTALEVAERRFHSGADIPGITTGLPELDGLTMGCEPGELWIVGARPSVGKSAALLNMALNAASTGARIGYALLEDSESSLGRRALAMKAGVDSQHLATGFLSAAEFAALKPAVDAMSEYPFHILAGYSGLSIGKLVTAVKSLHRSHHIDILYVDYLQLLTGPGDKKHEKIAAVTESLKALAMQLEIPVVAAAQLRRDAEGRVPGLADFADSSEIEKAANIALILHREPDGEQDNARQITIYAEKVRDGQTGFVRTVFHKQYLRFREMEMVT